MYVASCTRVVPLPHNRYIVSLQSLSEESSPNHMEQ